MQDITSSPEFKAAVAEAAAQAAAQAVAAALAGKVNVPAGDSADWSEFMASMKSLANAMEVQRPGYAKPLSPEELADREEGRAEFFRLIAEAAEAVQEFGRRGAREEGMVPEYVVGPNGFYMQTDEGEQLFSPGQPIFLTVAPPEDFEPLNEPAAKIMHAQRQWLGQPTEHIADMVAKAQMRALGHDPDKADRDTTRRNRVVAEVDRDRESMSVGPRRILGTTVEETANDGHTQFRLTKGQVARPVSGPVFVG